MTTAAELKNQFTTEALPLHEELTDLVLGQRHLSSDMTGAQRQGDGNKVAELNTLITDNQARMTELKIQLQELGELDHHTTTFRVIRAERCAARKADREAASN